MLKKTRIMKQVLLSGFLMVSTLLFFTSCENDRCQRTQEFVEFQPVYKRIEEMRVPAKYSAARELGVPGKIFYYKGYMLINEMNEGIHVIDNRNPSSPSAVGFIEIPGNIDMAVHDNILYADNYLDLVAINIVNPTAPFEVGRVNDVFQTFYSYSDQNGYLVEYTPTDVKRQISCDDANWGNPMWFEGDLVFLSNSAEFDFASSASGNVASSAVIGGSMARFTTAKDHLYTIDGQEIKVFDVSLSSTPVLQNEVYVQWGIETLFPVENTLFIGSNAGVFIYDISNPASPIYTSSFAHATSCDPVFVSGDRAYVTLRSGNTCFGVINQLDVLDVSNLNNPQLIQSYPMTNPHGLSVVDNTLYLCEGQDGLKVFDVTNDRRINENLLDHVTGFFAYDVIVLPTEKVAMVVGQDGLYQYNATDPNKLESLSVIPVNR